MISHQEFWIEVIFYSSAFFIGILESIKMLIEKVFERKITTLGVIIMFISINIGLLASFMIFEGVESIIGHGENYHEVNAENEVIIKNVS